MFLDLNHTILLSELTENENQKSANVKCLLLLLGFDRARYPLTDLCQFNIESYSKILRLKDINIKIC